MPDNTSAARWSVSRRSVHRTPATSSATLVCDNRQRHAPSSGSCTAGTRSFVSAAAVADGAAAQAQNRHRAGRQCRTPEKQDCPQHPRGRQHGHATARGRSENDTLTRFDWSSLQAAQRARAAAVPEMINHALMVLADLLEDGDLACEFHLTTGPLTDSDIAVSVKALLPDFCRVQGLEWVPSWRISVDQALPGLFLPTREPNVWAQDAPPRTLAETLADWAMALMSRLWPDDAECWNLTVESDDWYAAAYVDLVINHRQQVWLLHLGVTD